MLSVIPETTPDWGRADSFTRDERRDPTQYDAKAFGLSKCTAAISDHSSLALLSSLNKHSQRNIVLIIEFHILVNSKITEPLSFGIPPGLLTFIRVIAIDWSRSLVLITLICFRLESIVESLASLNNRKWPATIDIFRLALFECLNGLMGR